VYKPENKPEMEPVVFSFIFVVLLPVLSRLSCHSIHDYAYTAIFLENEHEASSASISITIGEFFDIQHRGRPPS